MKVERWQLQQRQSLSLNEKILLTDRAIINWYEHFHGQVTISFSGGKDSTVLLHKIRQLYPNVPAIFVDTGLEYPEIRGFVRSVSNVIWAKPSMRFQDVIVKYGMPIISKKIAHKLHTLQNPTPKNLATRVLAMSGVKRDGSLSTSFKIPAKWLYLQNAPFKISAACCDKLKKAPLVRAIGSRYPYTGIMASDSNLRASSYLAHGCNIYNAAHPISSPLGFWTENDIWDYIRTFDLPYSSIYDMGEKRTGCAFCMFGVHLEKEPNRFQRMQMHHPKLHDYCINKLGLNIPLDYIGVKYTV